MADNRGRDGFRNVLALGFVSFFTDISSEMSFGILPTFLTVELGASTTILGLVEGLAEWLSYALRMVSGLISDIMGRRKLLVFVGYSLSSAVKPLFALARSWVDVLAVRLSDRIGKGIRQAPRDTLLSESVSEKHLGKAFGLHRTLDQLGAIIGPLLAIAIIPFYGIRGVFLISVIPALTAVLILVFLVKERAKGKAKRRRILANVRAAVNRRFVLLLFVMAIFSVGAFNFSFIIIKAKTLGVVEVLIPLVYAIINMAHTAVGIPVGTLSDKIGSEKTLVLGYAAFALTSLMCIALSGNPLYAFLIAAVYGVYDGTKETVQRAIIPKYTRKELLATAYGIYYIVIGTCLLPANLIIGALWDILGTEVAFSYSLVTSLTAIISVLIFTKTVASKS